ncbi:hypothetical protein GY45DRAFT_1417929 [Cubamyces sp. BRFM 1775]|nr:hypothetical protein GY45DRAFT_1417929 [Cubamyces sp. BRFM 1775]
MSFPGGDTFDYFERFLSGVTSSTPASPHLCGETRAPFQWFCNADASYRSDPAPMSYPMTYASVNEAVAIPLGPSYARPGRPSDHGAASLSISPLVPPPMRPPTSTTIPVTYNPSAAPLSTASAQQCSPLPYAAARAHPFLGNGFYGHHQPQEYPLESQLQRKLSESQNTPWMRVSGSGEHTRTVGATYPLGSSSLNIPRTYHPIAHATPEPSAATPMREPVGRIARKRKNEDKENASSSTLVPSRKRRRLRKVHDADGPPGEIPMDSGSGGGVMRSEQSVATSIADTGGYLPPYTCIDLDPRTTAHSPVNSSEQAAPYTYPPPLPLPHQPSDPPAPPATPQAQGPRRAAIRPSLRASCPRTIAPPVISAVNTQPHVDVVPADSEVAWDSSREMYPGAAAHAAKHARSSQYGCASRIEGDGSRSPRPQAPLRPDHEVAPSQTPCQGVERVPLAEAGNSTLRDGFMEDETGRTICPFVKCTERLVHRSDCERHVKSLHLNIEYECRLCEPHRRSKNEGSFGRLDGFQRHLRESCLGKERYQAIKREHEMSSLKEEHTLERRYGRIKLPCKRSRAYKDGEKILPMFKMSESWESFEKAHHLWILARSCPANCCPPPAEDARRELPKQETAGRASSRSDPASNSPESLQGANALAGPSQLQRSETPHRVLNAPARPVPPGEGAPSLVQARAVPARDQLGEEPVNFGELDEYTSGDTAASDEAEAGTAIFTPRLPLSAAQPVAVASPVASPPRILEDGIRVNGLVRRVRPAIVSPPAASAARVPLGTIDVNNQQGDGGRIDMSTSGLVGDFEFDSSFDSMFDQCIAELGYTGANAGDMFRFID